MTDDPMDKIYAQIQKLLNLAEKNSNEAEAAAAASKAQELLTKYNLDAALVERKGGVDGKREENLVEGGFYVHQRELWSAVAKLNFCMYWTQNHYVKRMGKTRTRGYHLHEVAEKRHRLIGRVVNTRSTIAMAQYLENVIERMLLERRGETKVSNWNMSFRAGVAHRMIEKVEDRREGLLKAEAAKKRAAEHAAGREGVSTSTAIALSDYVKSEHDANIDFIYGDGTSARWAVDRAEMAAERRREREAYTKWAAENPAEAAAKEKERFEAEKRASKRSGRSYSGPKDVKDYGAFYAGYDSAKDVSIDQQMDGRRETRKIAGW